MYVEAWTSQIAISHGKDDPACENPVRMIEIPRHCHLPTRPCEEMFDVTYGPLRYSKWTIFEFRDAQPTFSLVIFEWQPTLMSRST